MASMLQLSREEEEKDGMQGLAEQQLPSPHLDFYDPQILPTQDLGSNLSQPTADIRWQQSLGFTDTYTSAHSQLPLITQTGPPFRAAQSQNLFRPGYRTDTQVQLGSTQRPLIGLETGFNNENSTTFSQFMAGPTMANPLQSAYSNDSAGFRDFMPISTRTPAAMHPRILEAPSKMGMFPSVGQLPVSPLISPWDPMPFTPHQPSVSHEPSKKRRCHQQGPSSHAADLFISKQQSKKYINTVGKAELTEGAITIIETWLNNSPQISIPDECHYEALALLTSLDANTVKMWFGQKMREGITSKSPTKSGSTSILKPQTSTSLSNPRPEEVSFSSLQPNTQRHSEAAVLREAALWVQNERGIKCIAKPDEALAREVSRIYQCTCKCGQDFSKKDDWRKHEEINYPQECWVCHLGACQNKPWTFQGRLSFRKQHFRQHFANKHRGVDPNLYFDKCYFMVESKFPRSCGFSSCKYRFHNWTDRIRHIGDHFNAGQDVREWEERSLEGGSDNEDHDGNDDSEDNDDEEASYSEGREKKDDDDDKNYRDDGPDDGSNDGSNDNSNDDSCDDSDDSCDRMISNSDDFSSKSKSGAVKQFHTGPMYDQFTLSVRPKLALLPPYAVLQEQQDSLAHPLLESSISSPSYPEWHGIRVFKQGARNFTRIRILGNGPHSTVDEVQYLDTKVVMARKTIYCTNEKSFNALQDELEIMKKLNHPHIVRFVGSYATDHSISILMTPSADCDLSDLLEIGIHKAYVSNDMVLLWFNCLVSSVHYLHEESIKHQDIKPSNILIKGSTILLSDFGISKSFLNSESTALTSGNVTRKYCSPETAHQGLRGRGSDIFSLGCVFVEMMSFLLSDGTLSFRDFQNSYFIGDGAYYENLLPVKDWLHLLQARRVVALELRLQRILDACEAMLEENARDRPTARDLAAIFNPESCCFNSDRLLQDMTIPQSLTSMNIELEKSLGTFEKPGELDSNLQESQKDELGTLYERFGKEISASKRTMSVVSSVSENSVIDLARETRKLIHIPQKDIALNQKWTFNEHELITYLSTGQLKTNQFLDSCDWYRKFINEKYKTCWSLIQPFVLGVSELALAPGEVDIEKVDHVLVFIAQALSKRKEISLAEIVDDLINNALINDEYDDRVATHQLVFCFLGWLTMLYEPRATCKPSKLQVAKFCLTTTGTKVSQESRTFNTYTQDLEYIDQPLFLLLSRFGKLIPNSPLQKRAEISSPSEWITGAFICYQTLRDVCRIEIEWVDALSLHLEFDSSRRILKIFRFPSFCRLMYQHKQRGLLSQLFNDNERDLLGSPSAKSDMTSDYFREVLLSYRLLFGQDPKSHRLFAKELASLSGKSSKHSTSCIFNLPDADPMLPKLCGYSWNSPGVAEIYQDIRAQETQGYYTPMSYPFLAQRLLALQMYVKGQHPHDWKTLWHDHRDKSSWWEFWAVTFIGSGTLILGTLSLVFQIWQTVLVQQQLVSQRDLQPE